MLKSFHLDKNHIANPIVLNDFLFYQAGSRHLSAQTATSIHKQFEFIELTAVIDGVGEIYANEVPTPVSKGDIFVSFPGDSHRISAGDKPLKFLFLAFQPTIGEITSKFNEIYLSYSNETRRVIRDEKIVSLIENAIVESDSEIEMSNYILQSTLLHISSLVVRAFNKKTAPKPTSPDFMQQFCHDIMNYINTHLFSLKKLNDLETAFNYNYSYMSNFFKNTCGFTINDYFRRVKMTTANKLIEENNLTLTEISQMLNYSSLYAFSKAYKDFFGYPPSQSHKS